MKRALLLVVLFLSFFFVTSATYAQETPNTPTPTPFICPDNVIRPTVFNVKTNNANEYYNTWHVTDFLQAVESAARCQLSSDQRNQLTTEFTADHTPTATPGGATPTQSPSTTSTCGTLNNTCCNELPNVNDNTSVGQDDFFCIDLLLTRFCLSSIVNGVSTLVGSTIGLDSLSKIGSCKQYQVDQNGNPYPDSYNPAPLVEDGVPYTLIPQHEDDGSCTCRRADGIESIKTEYCARYIGSSIRTKTDKPVTVGELKSSPEYNHCTDCFSLGGHWSALGCIYTTNWPVFIQQNVLGLAVSLGGIAAFICILYAAFVLQTSAGNPERIKNAQQLLTSCIMGLMLIIFSVFILRLIGVTILHIPGLS